LAKDSFTYSLAPEKVKNDAIAKIDKWLEENSDN